MEGEKLQKILAARGLTSRRKAEDLLRQGKVLVNGRPASLGDRADPDRDEITVDGSPLPEAAPRVVYLLNKPRGFVTTARDEQGRRTVLDLVPREPRVYPVGRLDLYSEGLLLLTNDGDLTRRLTHPGQETEKAYHLWVNGCTDAALERLGRPIVLDGRPIRKPRLRVLHREGEAALLEVTIHEGRNRQLRRMCQAAGLSLTRLKRVREGSLTLGDLPVGQYRVLTEEEIDRLTGGDSASEKFT